jgi:uncharacterized protein with FMN-binding domain
MAGEKHFSNSLVALGSAAVVAVYSAGFVRTRAAAAQFAEDDARARRRPAAPAATVVATRATATESRAEPATAIASSSPSERQAARPTRPETRRGRSGHVRVGDAPAAGTPPVAAAARADTIQPLPTVIPADTAKPPTDTAKSAADSTKPAAAATSLYRDGTYSGWGTSRHGDIQATVLIKGGRITDAYITQCLTQYSCSWISALPPQVSARQSADVDYVSGATQSSNAFYSAVLQALNHAK